MDEKTKLEKLERSILLKLKISDYGEAIGTIAFLFHAVILVYMIYSSRIPTGKDIILFLVLTFMIGIGFYSLGYKTKIQDAMINVLLGKN